MMDLSSSRSGKSGAVVEVVLAFGLVHVAFRALKQFTDLGRLEREAGLNFSPGFIMILVSLVLLLVRRRSLREAGLVPREPRADANIGLLCLALVLVCGSVLVLLGVRYRPREMGPADAVAVALAGLAGTLATLWVLRRRPDLPRHVPAWVTLVLVAGILAAPVVAALLTQRDARPVLLGVAWRCIGAGIGEEVFFRGYVQSRLNGAFGRPWRLLGVAFGPGLVIATLLFSAIHALNTADYFAGSYQFAWWHALATLGVPYGWLREKTGSIAAPVVVHGLLDVVALLTLPAAGA